MDLSKQLFIVPEQIKGRFDKVQIVAKCTATKKATEETASAKKTKTSSMKSPVKEQSKEAAWSSRLGKLAARK